MGLSLSHGRQADPGGIGIPEESLPPAAQGRLDLRGWFDAAIRDHPLELEIGSGKGTFLVQQAVLFPGVNFVGIEWSRPFWKYAADRARRKNLANVRVVRTEAGGFVRQYVPDGCLRQVHIYFPDPWPKKRHHKRRLIQEPFLRELWRILEFPVSSDSSSGLIRIATDHGGYFEWIEEHAGKAAELFERLPFESPGSASEGELVGSNFERKYRLENRHFFALSLRKRAR